ncbi:hypothetical protein [Chromobacterium sp. ATCC 53434]|uniref:hypothetical protein n=1 Tax=Chromobacterium sp. (strain ATCC 53434 / SC 14030) TaxID=2059672 RepID=UPI0013051FBA|nr:hypothetical protein [Chromobacterium sp. ATCC 53434]
MLSIIGQMTTGDYLLNHRTPGDKLITDDDGPIDAHSVKSNISETDPNEGTPAAIVTLSGQNGDVEERAIVYEKPKVQASGQSGTPGKGTVDVYNHNEFYVKDGGKFLSCAWSIATLTLLPEYKEAKSALDIANDLLQRTKTTDDAISDCQDGVGIRMVNHKPQSQSQPSVPKSIGGGDCSGISSAHMGTVNNATVSEMGNFGSKSGYVECSDPVVYDGTTSGGGSGGISHFIPEMD